MQKRVCIIGAGASGLSCLKHVLQTTQKSGVIGGVQLEGTIFEESDQIGGIWNYEDSEISKNPDRAWHSPMYKGLRTNLPKEVMLYLDFTSEQYDVENRSFLTRSEVLAYLNKYADHFGLRGYIQFNRRVTKVARKDEEEKWEVHVQDPHSNTEVHLFDSVVVCNGHFNKPVPLREEIISNFKGKIFHSQFYRTPDEFQGMDVVVIGCGPSGTDIAIELSKCAKTVYLSAKKNKPKVLGIDEVKNIEQIPEVIDATQNSVILDDGREIPCSGIIYCTGYQYGYEFLDNDLIQIQANGKKVHPLYLQIFHPEFPTLAFIGLQFLVCPFLLFDCQTRFYIKYLEGGVDIGSVEERWSQIKQEEEDRRRKGLDGRKSHQLSTLQWPYFERLAHLGGFSKELEAVRPSKIREMYEEAGVKRKNTPLTYRDQNYT